jgi:hypothetical protein
MEEQGSTDEQESKGSSKMWRWSLLVKFFPVLNIPNIQLPTSTLPEPIIHKNICNFSNLLLKKGKAFSLIGSGGP